MEEVFQAPQVEAGRRSETMLAPEDLRGYIGAHTYSRGSNVALLVASSASMTAPGETGRRRRDRDRPHAV